MNSMASLVFKYNTLITTKPLRTNMVSALVMYGMGDYVSQIFIEK